MINKTFENNFGKITITEDVIREVIVNNIKKISSRKIVKMEFSILEGSIEVAIYLDGKFDNKTYEEISILRDELNNIVNLELNLKFMLISIIIG